MNRPMTRRAFVASGVAAVVGLAAACRDDGDADTAVNVTSSTTEATTAPGALDLPENDKAKLQAIFDPRFEPLGLHVTRIGLYNLDAGFQLDDEGRHMAIYVEPIDAAGVGWDAAHYIEMTVPGLAVSAPYVFDTWADVQSMDLCQEPPRDEAPEEEPPIETQALLSRADSLLIDWDNADLADLIGAALLSPDSARVVARPEVEAHPLWRAAEAAAPGRVGLG